MEFGFSTSIDQGKVAYSADTDTIILMSAKNCSLLSEHTSTYTTIAHFLRELLLRQTRITTHTFTEGQLAGKIYS